jgi:hypothetical protein
LWNSISCGSIPVVLSGKYNLPGNKSLWDQAIVSYSEQPKDILSLPELLENMSHDEALLERKRHAMRQISMIYGPDCFIYDILKLFLSLANETAKIPIGNLTFSYGSLYAIATEINTLRCNDPSAANIFILGCSIRVIFDPSGFLTRYHENNEFRTAFKQALTFCKPDHAQSMKKALQLKKITLEHISAK